jgi:SAM-dependent methyltransferase
MLKVAHQKLAAAGLSVPLIRANLVELDGLRDQSFDYAACLFSTLGMVRGRENRRQVLQHVRRVLKPGGRFLLHVHNLWFHLGTRLGRRWLLRDGLRQLGRADDAGDFEMPPHEGIAGLSLHHYARREVLRELRAAGFRIQTVKPIGTRPDAQLRRPWFLSGVRAYGFLIGAERA